MSDNPLIQSIKRGCVQLVRRPMYILTILVMPILTCLVLLNMLGPGVVQRVPVGIVDLDNSALSRQLMRNLQAFQQVNINAYYKDFDEAKEAVKRGEVLGFFYIPTDFDERALGGRQPTVSYYCNYAYYAPASMQYKGFKTISLLANGGIVQTVLRTAGLRNEQISSTLQPILDDVHMPGNPWINYNYYLNSTFVPCLLALFILMVTSFSLGSELKSGFSPQWLRTGGNSILISLVGKLLPQTVLFTVMGWFIQWIMYRCLYFPLHCPAWHMMLAMFLLVIANQSFVVLIFGFVPNFRYGTTICTLFGMLSFSFCGFSLPQESLYSWVNAIGYVMPIKYYFLISGEQALNGWELFYSRWWYIALIAFCFLPLFTMWRLKQEARHPNYVP